MSFNRNQKAANSARKGRKLVPLRWDGIVYFSLLGCIPAMLAAWALAVKEIHFKVDRDAYFHATPDDDPFFYWTYIALFCAAAAFLWGSTIYSVVKIIAWRWAGPREKGYT